jgi:phosphotransferase family enzyme
VDVDSLLARARDVRPFAAADGKSGAHLEQVTIDGEPHVVKRVSYRDDWLMQVLHDRDGAVYNAWTAGLLDRLPDCIDHAIVAMSREETADGAALTFVMRDVGQWLVPDTEAEVSREQHLRFFDHMAALHAEFWGWSDHVGLIGLYDRYSIMTVERMRPARAACPRATVPPLVLQGWEELPGRDKAMADRLFALHADPAPLISALADTPHTFLHGDWKLANLGSHPDGRTILIDWAFPGSGPPCVDLAHYVALNRRRLAGTKEDAFAAYRDALDRRGVDTAPWWDRQLALCLLGIMVALGWEKALGDDDELSWWSARVTEGAALL